jgi:hypothetical protein
MNFNKTVFMHRSSTPLNVMLKDEIGTSREPALITLKIGDRVWLEVEAVIEKAKGADGGWYDIVKFRPKIIDFISMG